MYLNCHSTFSLRYGLIPVQQLLELAKARGLTSLALTDINNTSATLEFVRNAAKYGITPKIGIDFRNGAKQLFIGLAKNNKGFQELNSYLSKYLHTKEPIPEKAPAFKQAFVIYPFHSHQEYRSLQAHEFLGVRTRDLNRLALSPWRKYPQKLVILQAVSFRNKADFNTHRLLRSIDNNLLLSKLPKAEQGQPTDQFLAKGQLEQLFQAYPKIIETTKKVLEACSIHFDFNSAKNKHYYTGDAKADETLLKALAYQGLEYRYGDKPSKKIITRIQKELKQIQELGYTAYFLINWDILKYARSKGYFYVGRGSGANSVVAYCLQITNVDPIELDLYFERFMNPYRKNPPDFDMDFSWKDRQDITRYIFKKHGHQYTALLATYNTFQRKAVIRELGKVLGLPKHELDKLKYQREDPENEDSIVRLIRQYSKRIHGLPNYLSVHSGGIIISQNPIHCYSATFLPPKGYPVTQFSMIESEDVGLYKYDILSQRGLGHIKDATYFVEQNQGKKLDIHDIQKFKEDPAIHRLLEKGQTVGCFYVESPAMRMLLKKLRAKEYKHLVAASSIIRPGVAKSGMMREYILRFHDRSRILQTPKGIRELLEETFGVMVYQEDVLKIAHHFAGLSLGEADVLRRGMSGKFRSRAEFDKVKDKFFANCLQKGHSQALITETWRQIESFAGYSFSKGHSASYAVESYQSLYLKAHYPLEFMVGVINNFGGFYRTEVYLMEARNQGAIVEAPCVNTSEYFTTIIGKTIYLGFVHLKGFERDAAEKIVKARRKDGKFKHLEDLLERVPLAIEQMRMLTRIGALRFTSKRKKELLWDLHMLHEGKKQQPQALQLFKVERKKYKLPPLDHSPYEDAYDELEILGFPLSSPFQLVKQLPKHYAKAQDLPKLVSRVASVVGYLVSSKRVRTSKDELMYFGNFLDENGHFIDTVHFPDSAKRYPFRGKGCYFITGKVVDEFGHLSMEVERMVFLEMVNLR